MTKHTSLTLGDRCHVTFNNETGEIAELLGYDEIVTDTTQIETLPHAKHPELEENPLLDIQGVSREQEIEELSGVLEYGSFSGTGN